MSDVPAFPYRLLWGERSLRSVANLTRRDGEEFMALAPKVPVRTEISEFALVIFALAGVIRLGNWLFGVRRRRRIK